ncbi:MAG TPA: Fe-S cluster assembly protein SufD [Chloroflexota bacterium]|nr:Fe-S cluster assembly protein SufD [Chloroflexota bacterium]
MAFTREAVEQLSSERSELTWLRQARLAAWERFEAMPMPDSSRDEDWRRTDISKLDLAAFAPALNGANTPSLSPQDVPLPSRGKRLGEGIPPGVIFCSLDEAVRRCPDLVHEHMEEPDGKFLSLNAALWAGGAFVYVPEGVQVEVPLHASHAGVGSRESGVSSALFPRTLIVVDRGASLVFVDHFLGQTDSRLPTPDSQLSSASTHIVVKDGATLSYVSLQERGQQTWHFATERAVIGRDAKVDLVVAALGSFLSKSYVETILTGPGSEANLVGLVLTDGQQHIDHQTLQEHRAPHTTSNLLLKSAVKGHSQSIFAGLVRMPREAQQSDAFQEARALLLSEHAKADAIPKLEIIANDVRCTHAGAIGQVDEEQKFYLMSRGIPEDEAERLIVTGFFEPALDRIPVDKVREGTRKALAHRLETVHG